MYKPKIFYFLSILVFGSLWTCKQEDVPKIFQPSSAHESYIHGLGQANLLHTQLGRQFVAAAEAALTDPIEVETPYQEFFYLHPEIPKAFGYKFFARRGEKVNIQINPNPQDSTILFIDLYRIEEEQSDPLMEHIASADKESLTLGFEPGSDARYLLRIQGELLHGGQYSVSIINKASFDFPVTGKDRRAIGSFFGDPRDGGRREHHGIDIFASRHTPIISPSAGSVRFAGEKGLGGRVVWLRDHEYNRTIYFAHLESILVQTGDKIEKGDTIGTVGNTGNARTTPPHLHFGIYQRGPIDPLYFVANQNPKLKKLKADVEKVGKLGRLNHSQALDIISGDTTFLLPKYQIVKIEAAFENQYRVRFSDNHYGNIDAHKVEPIHKPINNLEEYVGHFLYQPGKNSIILDTVETPTAYQVLGIDQDYRLVQNSNKQIGWITQPNVL